MAFHEIMRAFNSKFGLRHLFCCAGLYFVYMNYGYMMGGISLDVTGAESVGALIVSDYSDADNNKNNKRMLGNEEKLFKPILRGNYFLYELRKLVDVKEKGHYGDVVGLFCELNWTKQKQTPNLVPRYSDVIDQSWDACENDIIKVWFSSILQETKRYDKANPTMVHSLKTAGFIYHESRSGSTLAANMLTVADPDTTRLYSEPKPLTQAMETGNEMLVRDVLYLLGRSNNRNEEKVFYKLRSTNTHEMSIMPQNVPWVFFYRKPEEVLASHFDPSEVDVVICLKSRKNPHKDELQMAARYDNTKAFASLPDADVCAIRLASIVQSAINEHNRTGKGYFLNYNTLPSSVWETVLPVVFKVDVDDKMIGRMRAISGVYSKTSWRKKEVKWDKEWLEKDDLNKRQRKAASKYMSEQYEVLEQLALRSWTHPAP